MVSRISRLARLGGRTASAASGRGWRLHLQGFVQVGVVRGQTAEHASNFRASRREGTRNRFAIKPRGRLQVHTSRSHTSLLQNRAKRRLHARTRMRHRLPGGPITNFAISSCGNTSSKQRKLMFDKNHILRTLSSSLCPRLLLPSWSKTGTKEFLKLRKCCCCLFSQPPARVALSHARSLLHWRCHHFTMTVPPEVLEGGYHPCSHRT